MLCFCVCVVLTLEDMAGQESAGASLIKRAVELDGEGRYEDALTFYQTGIQQLLTTLKGIHTMTSLHVI